MKGKHNNRSKQLKAALASSSGGHWEELMWISGLGEKYDVFYVTEKSGFLKAEANRKIYTVPKIDRKEKHFLLHFVKLVFTSLRIFLKEKPDVLISTGALAAIPLLYWGWIFRKTVIFIDSIARIEDLSLSGKLVYPIADLFIVQWKALQKKYPKAVYASGIFGDDEI